MSASSCSSRKAMGSFTARGQVKTSGEDGRLITTNALPGAPGCWITEEGAKEKEKKRGSHQGGGKKWDKKAL